jgi:Carboxypeptidase regulatory-like domain
MTSYRRFLSFSGCARGGCVRLMLGATPILCFCLSVRGETRGLLEQPEGLPVSVTASPLVASGELVGKLTDWHSLPLAQAVIVARNVSTGAATRGMTGRNGSYHFSGLGPGEYRIEADVPQLGKGAVEGILVSPGHVTRVQAALVLEVPTRTLPFEAEPRELDPMAPAITTLIQIEEPTEIHHGIGPQCYIDAYLH